MFYLVLLFTTLCATATERISLFKADITVNPDGTLLVSETIKVHAQGDQIRRGIIREIPTRYKDSWGNNVAVAFTLSKVQRDGATESYHLKSASNGIKLFIGDADIWLSPGDYTYTISYKTNRQIGFFDNHDELYFNVTGNGWRLPIERAIAIVHLPQGIPSSALQVAAYTGYQGDRGDAYQVRTTAHGALVFETTRPLNVYQGLTIVAGWPKGYVIKPSFWQEIKWFFEDNFALLLALLGMILLLGYYLRAWHRIKARERAYTVIPLFYPPDGMTAGAVRYLAHMGYDAKGMAADVVQMAVDGYITIDQKKGYWKMDYVLNKLKDPAADYANYGLFIHLFSDDQQSVTFASSNQKLLSNLYQQQINRYKNNYGTLLDSNWVTVAIGYVIAIATIMAALFFQINAAESILSWLTIFAIILIAFIFTRLLRSYSNDGMALKAQIEGFKLFLEATEKDRFEIIGTPPTKTPQLYEKYLPYAIALEVEKAWSAQFAPIFEAMSKQGNPYVMGWYMGRSFDRFDSSSFSSTIGDSISNAISSSGVKPGSSSGFGGGGSSGGGSGGGGGGGW